MSKVAFPAHVQRQTWRTVVANKVVTHANWFMSEGYEQAPISAGWWYGLTESSPPSALPLLLAAVTRPSPLVPPSGGYGGALRPSKHQALLLSPVFEPSSQRVVTPYKILSCVGVCIV